MAYIYILECADGSLYTGSTRHLEKRLQEHQQGEGARHTAKRLPVRLVYWEKWPHVGAAFEREKQIQGWSRKKKQALIAGEFERLPELSICQNSSHCCYWRAGFDSVSAGFDSLRHDSGQAAQPADAGDSAQSADTDP